MNLTVLNSIMASMSTDTSEKDTMQNLGTVSSLEVWDVRFPTSLQMDGSDAMHTDPDYSCAYVKLSTSCGQVGYGLTFTLGRGTDVVVGGVKALEHLVVGRELTDIYGQFGDFWRVLTSESQLRWIGPEKGVMHLATAAVINALWDLWARIENKPLWKLLADMDPAQLVSTIDFRYITDVVTREEAIEMLKSQWDSRESRMKEMSEGGYPAYTTQVGWLGYSDEKVLSLCEKYLAQGYTAFKVKVGADLNSDKNRCGLVRKAIGEENLLMIDANQRWDVNEAISWTKSLKEYRPLWIEEPTSPDDVLGHATIAKELKETGIAVATGEMAANRIIFKQLLQASGAEYIQVDSCRVGGVNELLAIYLMARKFKAKVCPHAGGVGLCEMVQHLQFWDYISLSGWRDGQMIEFVDQQHEHFVNPAVVVRAHYQLPKAPGYSTEMTKETLEKYVFPTGIVWQNLSPVPSFGRRTLSFVLRLYKYFFSI